MPEEACDQQTLLAIAGNDGFAGDPSREQPNSRVDVQLATCFARPVTAIAIPLEYWLYIADEVDSGSGSLRIGRRRAREMQRSPTAEEIEDGPSHLVATILCRSDARSKMQKSDK